MMHVFFVLDECCLHEQALHEAIIRQDELLAHIQSEVVVKPGVSQKIIKIQPSTDAIRLIFH